MGCTSDGMGCDNCQCKQEEVYVRPEPIKPNIDKLNKFRDSLSSNQVSEYEEFLGLGEEGWHTVTLLFKIAIVIAIFAFLDYLLGS